MMHTTLAFTALAGLVAGASQETVMTKLAGAKLPTTVRGQFKTAGFAVVPTRAKQFTEVYTHAREANEPMVVTTDAVLHAAHKVFDYQLRALELRHLNGLVKDLSGKMLAAHQKLLAEGSCKKFKLKADQHCALDEIRMNVAFFAVAMKLLDPSFGVPAEVKSVVAEECALIAAHRGFVDSPLMGIKEDYSQYVPRGHYTANATFRRYFKAMMWYGRMPFYTRNKDLPKAKIRSMTIQALLIARAMQDKSVATLWQNIYEPTTFFVGKADDLVPDQVRQAGDAAMKTIPAFVFDMAKVDDVANRLNRLAAPRILSTLVVKVDLGAKDEEIPRSFRFMGQRFVPDSFMFQQLVYDRVRRWQGKGKDKPFTAVDSPAGVVRGFPRGLDVMAVLGSKRARALLDELGDSQFQRYDSQLARLRGYVKELSPAQWEETLYWRWLGALRPVLGRPALSESLAKRLVWPKSEHWQNKMLTAALGSWTELRHDTILYAKQSYGVKAGMGPPPQPELTHGFVEPYPDVYEAVREMIKTLRTGLETRGHAIPKCAKRMAGFEQTLGALAQIARLQAQGKPLAKAQYERIWNIGRELDMASYVPWKLWEQIKSEADKMSALVADVHTDTNSDQVLEEATGRPGKLYLLVPDAKGGLQVAVGPVFTYYEFKRPVSGRLTDEAWQQIVGTPAAPEAPAWIRAYTVKR